MIYRIEKDHLQDFVDVLNENSDKYVEIENTLSDLKFALDDFYQFKYENNVDESDVKFIIMKIKNCVDYLNTNGHLSSYSGYDFGCGNVSYNDWLHEPKTEQDVETLKKYYSIERVDDDKVTDDWLDDSKYEFGETIGDIASILDQYIDDHADKRGSYYYVSRELDRCHDSSTNSSLVKVDEDMCNGVPTIELTTEFNELYNYFGLK